MNTQTLDKKYLVRNSTELEIEITKTDHFSFFYKSGKEYIDLVMGWCVGNLGWGNDVIKNVIQNYRGPDYVYPGFIYKPWAELAESLASIAPGDLKMVCGIL